MGLSEKLFLLPFPKKFKAGNGFLNARDSRVWIDEKGMPRAEKLRVEKSRGISNPEGYSLVIDSRGIRIECAHRIGVKHAGRTLLQLSMASEGGRLPFVEIEDWPDLPVRGFMLDISRCKVPKMEELFWLVEKLALFKYNRLELYTEHTYAFEGHQIVWGDSSPMTASQYADLDRFCNAAGIELVPNMNGLGHMERWLRYPRYAHLAEITAPFVDPLGTVRKYPTTLFPNKESLDFMDSLYSQFLPNFSSDKINIGGDEPWELGMGRSAKLCGASANGKYDVYVDYMLGLRQRIAARGKRAYMWADVLMQKRELAERLPKDMTPVLWGYYLDHPYESQCRYMASLGRNFMVAPGTSTWNSFGSRWSCAEENIKVACECAKAFKAEGALLTQWGDGGNHQPWCAMYPAIAAAGAAMWGNCAEESDVCRALDLFVFEDASGNFSRALCNLGRVDPEKKLFCFYHKLFFANPEEAGGLLDGRPDFNPAEISELAESCRSLAVASAMKCPDAGKNLAEFNLAADMINFACARASDPRVESYALQGELKRIAGEYERVWLMRARPGGLAESSGKIRAICPDIFR